MTAIPGGTEDVRKAFIYGLKDDRQIRYVGYTIDLKERIRSHRKAASRGVKTPVYDWLRKWINERQSMPEAIVLEQVPLLADSVAEAEQRWIDTLRSDGCNLLNVALGGYGCVGRPLTAIHRARIGKALKGRRSHRKGKKLSPEHAAKVAAVLARWRDENGGPHTGHRHSPETCRKIAIKTSSFMRGNQYAKGRVNTALHNKRISEALKARYKRLGVGSIPRDHRGLFQALSPTNSTPGGP